MAYARWTPSEEKLILDMIDDGLSGLEIAKNLSRRFPERTEASIRTKVHDILHPNRRFKKNIRAKKIPEMIPGHDYNIMCPQYWQPMGKGGRKDGAVKKLQLVNVSEGMHTRHYVFKHPAGWQTSVREQDLRNVLIIEKGV